MLEITAEISPKVIPEMDGGIGNTSPSRHRKYVAYIEESILVILQLTWRSGYAHEGAGHL